MTRKAAVLVGDRYGKLVVRADLGTFFRGEWGGKKLYARKLSCLCACGKSVSVWAAHLRSGSTKSCGCLHKGGSRLSSGEAAFRAVFRSYQANAKNRGIGFDLTEDRFRALVQLPCSYCGISACSVARTRAALGDFTYTGLDRVNSALGYVEGNVVPCCAQCNTAKMDYDLSDFLAWVNRVYEHSVRGAPPAHNLVRVIF